MSRAAATGLRRSLSCGLTLVSCAVGIAACGGSGSKPSASSDPQLAISECMRAHGVTNFPDPTRGPGGEGMSITATPGSDTLTVEGIAFSGPAFEAAEKVCKLFGGGTSPPPITESQKVAAFQFAQCIRTHGVPDYPDPEFPAGGGIERPDVPGLNRQSPALQRAVAACNKS
ncbi:MAG: hypothetical protein ABSG43_09300 [Solirubrobacteraceae bacterium]|jgi:hypothetical protein